jgi:dTDP-4-dehydrorhamnose reductase
MKVLVTGSSGMLGRALSAQLKKNHSIIGVTRHGGEGSFRCDLSDAPAVRTFFENNPVDFVIHTAAWSDVDGCERDPKLAYAANALAPKNLSAVCAAKRIPWIHVSTDYVFDGAKRAPYLETDACGPINIYGLTKWIGEFYALNSVTNAAAVRTSWLFGMTNPRTFVDAIAKRILHEKNVGVLDDQIDAPTSVTDLSLALECMMEYMLKLPSGKRWNQLYHVCNEGGATRLQMALQIRDDLGAKDVKIERTDPSAIKGRVAVRPEFAVMSKEKFERTFGMKLRPWQQSLREYIQSL